MPKPLPSPVEKYVSSKRPNGEGYAAARDALIANDAATDDATLAAFFEKALAHLSAAHSEADGYGPRAFAAFHAAASAVKNSAWCALLSGLDVDTAREVAPLLRTAEYAAHVPDAGGAAGRDVVRALASNPALVRQLVAVKRRFAFGVPDGWLAVLLVEGGAEACAALEGVVDEACAARGDRRLLEFLLAHAPPSPTPAAATLIASARSGTDARHQSDEHPIVLSALGLTAYPVRCQVHARWRSTSGHALVIMIERHGPADPPTWFITFGKSKPVLRATSHGQYPNKFGIPFFGWSTFGTWLAAVEARFKTRFTGPVHVHEHGFPRLVQPHLVAFLTSLRAPPATPVTKRRAPARPKGVAAKKQTHGAKRRPKTSP
jgi:hypothetical protein